MDIEKEYFETQKHLLEEGEKANEAFVERVRNLLEKAYELAKQSEMLNSYSWLSSVYYRWYSFLDSHGYDVSTPFRLYAPERESTIEELEDYKYLILEDSINEIADWRMINIRDKFDEERYRNSITEIAPKIANMITKAVRENCLK